MSTATIEERRPLKSENPTVDAGGFLSEGLYSKAWSDGNIPAKVCQLSAEMANRDSIYWGAERDRMQAAVTASTDGSCDGTGTAGYSSVIRDGLVVREISGAFWPGTNNSAELKAILEAMKYVERSTTIKIRTDSSYAKHVCETWCWIWEKNGWLLRSKGSKGTPVKNRPLIEALMVEMRRHKSVRFVLVKGHSGDPDNQRADTLAKSAAIRGSSERRNS